jgi:putative transposase
LCDKYKSKYPHFIDRLISNKERYFPFIDYPYPVRKLIYTTNAVENFNSLLEKIRINNGGYFQSRDYVDAAVFVLANRLLNKKWNNPLPVLKGYEYEINQLFNLRFSDGQTQFH